MLLGLAPMDWFTDYAFRQITKEIFQKYGEKEKYEFYLRTEFMNADGYIINPIWVIKHLLSNQEQSPLIAQIFGNNEKMLVDCFVSVEKKYTDYFQGIELNLWCPAKTVIQNWWWSAMLKDRKQILKILENVKKHTTLPLSIKTRTGITDDDKSQQKDFLIQASKYCSMITIHGRTVKQGYSWDADWEFIYHLKEEIIRQATKKPLTWNMQHATICKILGNGWITSYEEIAERKWNLDGIMIGQTAIGNPRIFTPHKPSTQELKETILRHLQLMVASELYFYQQAQAFTGTLIMPSQEDLDNVMLDLTQWKIEPQNLRSKHSHLSSIVVAFRKHLFQYIKGIDWSKERKRKISTIKNYNELVEEIQEFFG